jgi:phage tail protein X
MPGRLSEAGRHLDGGLIVKLRWWVVPILVAAVLLASYGLARTVRFATETVRVTAPDPGAQTAQVEFQVRMLKCRTTSNLFTGMMSAADGVIEIRTFVRTHTALITYDPRKTSPERLAERINRPVLNPETGQTMSVFEVQKMNSP